MDSAWAANQLQNGLVLWPDPVLENSEKHSLPYFVMEMDTWQ